MTILVAHNRYRIRGGEDGVFETECRLLEEAGHRVVRYEKSNCDIPDRGGRLGLACRTIWNGRAYREIREIIRREKPDVMHCHNTFPLISPSIYWAAAREGVPVVQTLHNYRLACLNGYLFRDGHVCEKCLGRTPWCGLRRRCYRGSLGGSLSLFAMLLVHRLLGTYRRKVTRYIALTDFARDKFVSAGLPAGKLVVKPNAFAAASGKRVGLPGSRDLGISGSRSKNPGIRESENPESLRVVYLGRLSPEKGVDVLLRAWALLTKEGRDAPTARPSQAPGGPGAADHSSLVTRHSSLVIVGDGPERVALEGLAGDGASVRFLGALPRDAALAELSSASLLVFPSLWYEQFAITPLEAMALGVPVLASDVARAGTILEDAVSGRFFRAGDPAALAAALRELLADPAALRRMGAAARAAFEASDCEPSRNLARLLDVYASARSARDA
ncbi:MAG: glycosyltransferase family 4 protein [Kiritimatiellae bacterium]|nr:glycosyltransferase family 4 protein [Kiritimatiellia bacterium]